jgi:predicted metal-dependent peptidase
MAADYVVNLMLEEERLTLPKGCLLDWQFKGMNMDQVYDYLIKHNVPPPPQDLPGGLSEPTDGDGEALSDQELKEAFQEAKEEVTQIQMTSEKAGTMPGGLGKAIKAAMTEEADWKGILAEFVDAYARADYSMARINRRALGRGLILPGLQSEDIGKIMVVLDTSGSTIDRPCLNEFLAQLFFIVDQYPNTGIQIVCCDTKPVLIGDYDAGDLPEPSELKLIGGGGTSLEKLGGFVEANDLFPTLAIYFTDCELYEWGDELEFPLLVASDSYPHPYYPLPAWVDQFVKL